jgi:hypothetical protein
MRQWTFWFLRFDPGAIAADTSPRPSDSSTTTVILTVVASITSSHLCHHHYHQITPNNPADPAMKSLALKLYTFPPSKPGVASSYSV